MSLKVHIKSACIAMPLNLMGCYTLEGDEANNSDRKIFTNYSANKFVLTGIRLVKKQYTGKTIQTS